MAYWLSALIFVLIAYAVISIPLYYLQDYMLFKPEKLLKYKFPTHEFVINLNCPIVIFHGTDDGVVPFQSGKKFFETLPEG